MIGSSHTAAFDCADGGSLVAACTGTVANAGPVDTSTVGSHTFSVNAADNVGNAAPTVSADYSVIWPWTGFAAPVNTTDSNGNSVLNAVNAGRAIPVKFSLGGNRGLDILAAGSPSSGSIACSATASTVPIEQTVSAGASSLSYDRTTGQYVYVWKTDKAWAGSCRQLSIRLIDGTTHKASFRFTK